jgi:hypothetical protein
MVSLLHGFEVISAILYITGRFMAGSGRYGWPLLMEGGWLVFFAFFLFFGGPTTDQVGPAIART